MEILNKAHFYNSKFIVFGHRGVPELCPENTIESFERAVALNYSGIELDVIRTADNVLIVNHDTIAKINNEEKKIDQLEYKHLLEFYPSIPTLTNVLDVLGHRTNINIEIKNQSFQSSYVIDKTISCLKTFNLIDNIVISSFNPKIIKKSKQIDDRFITAWILGHKNFRFYSFWKIILNYFKPNAIHINHQYVNLQIIDRIHAHRMKILSYTVNSGEILEDLISKKIDGIFTDSPKILELSKRLNL